METTGDYPPDHVQGGEGDTLLESFDAARGTGQGDVTSPTCWVAVMDIMLTALRAHDQTSTSKTYYRGDGINMYTSEETSYADDMESITNDPIHLQEKADIVSAYCILAGLQLSHDKLRRVMQTLSTDTLDITTPTDTIVHIHPWTPKTVKVNTTEPTEYLGGLYDTHFNGKAVLKLISEVTRSQCNAIKHSSVSPASKIMVAISSTLAKVRYKAALSSIRLLDLRNVDKIFSDTFRAATHNMGGFPTALIYLAKNTEVLEYDASATKSKLTN